MLGFVVTLLITWKAGITGQHCCMHHSPWEDQHSESKVTDFIEHVILYSEVETSYLGMPVSISLVCYMWLKFFLPACFGCLLIHFLFFSFFLGRLLLCNLGCSPCRPGWLPSHAPPSASEVQDRMKLSLVFSWAMIQPMLSLTLCPALLCCAQEIISKSH